MSRQKKIIVSVSNDITADQRVHRVCNTLLEEGFEVILLGRKFKNSLKLNNRNYKCIRFRLLFNKGFLFYFCLNFRIFIYLLFNKSGFLLANDLDTLPANYLAAKIKGCKLFYDSHELFTEVPELENRKFVKKFWLGIEKICFPKIHKAYTVSESIAGYYQKKYNINFSVVRNLPYYRKDKTEYLQRDNILIYQGALNKDRGLELLIEAMQYIDKHKLIIAGDGNLSNELKILCKKLNLNSKIEFTGKLAFEDLNELTSKALLGFSLEQNTNLNYYYSLPNKIFDYINSGTPVLCPDLPEMKKIIENYNTGTIFSGTTAKELSEKISEVLNDNNKLIEWHNNCINASKELCWENEKEKLKSVFL